MKTLLILYPYKFTEFDNYKYEISHLEKKKNFKVIIHDLSNTLTNERFNETWKTKKAKGAIAFTSLVSWMKEFKKIKKKKDVLVYDFLDYSVMNFKVLLIKLILKISQLPKLKYGITEVAKSSPKKKF